MNRLLLLLIEYTGFSVIWKEVNLPCLLSNRACQQELRHDRAKSFKNYSGKFTESILSKNISYFMGQ